MSTQIQSPLTPIMLVSLYASAAGFGGPTKKLEVVTTIYLDGVSKVYFKIKRNDLTVFQTESYAEAIRKYNVLAPTN